MEPNKKSLYFINRINLNFQNKKAFTTRYPLPLKPLHQ